MGLKFLQVNICGLSQRSQLCLDKYINENLADVVFLSETKCTEMNTFTNFNSILKQNKINPTQQGGVAILAQQSITVDRLGYLERDDIDAIFAVVTIGNNRLLVSSVYIPPNSPQKLNAFTAMITVACSQINDLKCKGLLIVGDLNARHREWGDKSDNKAGVNLCDYVSSQNLYISDKLREDTFVCNEGGSRIDLMIVSNKLRDVIKHQHIDAEIELFTGAPHRGHIPVWSMLNLSQPVHTPRQYYAWQTADWQSFSDTLDRLTLKTLPQLVETTDPRELWLIAKSLLLQAKNQVVPQLTTKSHSKPYWNNELSNLSKQLRIARKAFKQRSNFVNGNTLQLAKQLFDEALSRARNTYVENKCEGLNQRDSASFWKSFKNTFYKRFNSSSHVATLVDQIGQIVTEDKAKADLLYEDIFLGNHLTNVTFDTGWESYVNNFVSSPQFFKDDKPSPYNEKITYDEIAAAHKRIKCTSKSSDPDGIHPLMIKFCGHQFFVLLYKLFNAVLTTKTWPWSEGEVIFLHKPGKDDYTNTSAYRPITKTSYIGKFLERVLEMRLSQHLSAKSIIPPSQNGFRKGYSTDTYMHTLISSIQHELKCKQKVAGIFVDLQKAFDSVWVNGLLFKMYQLGIRGSFLELMSGFLRYRKISLTVNGHTTPPTTCKIGVPQGSVLSPTLFSMYVHDMLENLSGTRLQYADDTSIVVAAHSNKQLEEICQTNCDVLQKWLTTWRLKANCSKTEFLLFSGECRTPTIRGIQISKADETKVLGILLDNKLKFDSQLVSSVKKMKSMWARLKPFVFSNLNIECSRRIFLTVILPKACYLAHLWDTNHRISTYPYIKDMLRVPFRPPLEHL